MKKLLVVVDYQNDFVDGSLGFEGAEKLDVGISDLIKTFAENGDDIIVTKDTHNNDYLSTREGTHLPVNHCIKNDRGHELFGKTNETILALKDIYFVEKESFGVSPSQMMDIKSKFSPIEITFVGLVSNICVLSNVCCFQAAYPQAKINVIEHLTDSFDKDLHKKTMDVLKGIQINII